MRPTMSGTNSRSPATIGTTSNPSTPTPVTQNPNTPLLNTIRTMLTSVCNTVFNGWGELMDTVSPARKRRRSTSDENQIDIQSHQHQTTPLNFHHLSDSIHQSPHTNQQRQQTKTPSSSHPPTPLAPNNTPARRPTKRVRLSNSPFPLSSNETIGLASLTPQYKVPVYNKRLSTKASTVNHQLDRFNSNKTPIKTPSRSIRPTENRSKLPSSSYAPRQETLDLNIFRYPPRRHTYDTPASRSITYAGTNEEHYRHFQRQRFRPTPRPSYNNSGQLAGRASLQPPPVRRVYSTLAVPMKPPRRERLSSVIPCCRQLDISFVKKLAKETKEYENHIRSNTPVAAPASALVENSFDENEKKTEENCRENGNEELSLDDFIASIGLSTNNANRTRAAFGRILSSRDKCRQKKLEVSLHEQSLASIYEKRALAKKMFSSKKQWQITEEGPEQPPNNVSYFGFNYWDERNPYWDEEEDDEAMMERQKKITVVNPKSAFAQLTGSSTKRLQRIFCDESNYHQTLAKIDGCIITGEDIRRLKPNCWLNDEIVNAYMALLTTRSQSSSTNNSNMNGGLIGEELSVYPKIKIMNSFFYARLVQVNPHTGTSEYMYSRVRRWTRRFDVFSFDKMIIPINMNNVHWTLGVINFKDKTVEHLDSMGTGGSTKIRQDLLQWVSDEAEDKGKPFSRSEWKGVERIVPIQENTDDCGVFLCKFADFICRGWQSFTFNQRHMSYFRARIAHELLMGKTT